MTLMVSKIEKVKKAALLSTKATECLQEILEVEKSKTETEWVLKILDLEVLFQQ